ncbi:hypothetical protein J19TS2_16890 [Cohnella xylanilytica]|uniref:hypothetical protein n=1 Tax=Cohnella xylanilytica TaxID=557555 RepID=UPI001B2C028B|nr:hypothetical protein [Cohnella xylanilytica]GIO12134.1 hypothetical protein J19TS2_16890 [Cohnella xylanilytica]
MCTGLAMYDTCEVTPMEACKAGESFFDAIGARITSAGYYTYKNEEDGLYVDWIETSLSELKRKIISKEVTAFRLYNEQNGYSPWFASFGYMTDEFSGFHHMDAQCAVPIDDIYENFIGFVEDVSKRISCPYGIVYDAPKVADAFYYAAGENLIKLFPYEDARIFNKETPGRFKGKVRYRGDMLRMVYPCSMLNDNHLHIDIQGMTLGEWIVQEQGRGSLRKIGNGLWLWEVGRDDMEGVSKCCGDAGILLAWKPPSPTKPPRTLP